MDEFIVNDLEVEVIALLAARAKEHGRSIDEEVRDILREAVKDESLSDEE